MADTTKILQEIKKQISSKYKSLSEFALTIGAVRQTLDYQVKGKSKLPLDTFIDICDALDVNPCYFFEKGYHSKDLSAFEVKKPSDKYYKKSQLSNDDIMKIQQENMNLRIKMQSAYQEMQRLQNANLKLIDLLSKA